MFCEDVLPVKEERWNVFTKHIIIIITGIIIIIIIISVVSWGWTPLA